MAPKEASKFSVAKSLKKHFLDVQWLQSRLCPPARLAAAVVTIASLLITSKYNAAGPPAAAASRSRQPQQPGWAYVLHSYYNSSMCKVPLILPSSAELILQKKNPYK